FRLWGAGAERHKLSKEVGAVTFSRSGRFTLIREAAIRGAAMDETKGVVRHVSDTALWAAVHRARETEREDAQFRDPFARRVAGERGEQIASAIAVAEADEWSWMARTYLFDRFIDDQVKQGADLVLNLGAGLDARPYRKAWPSSLTWIEADLPEIFD